MSDIMTFPKTVEEFMDQYKIVDTEKIYSNGIELVPIFRMKQWFEHCSTSSQEMSAVEYLWQKERQLEEYGFKRFLESREDARGMVAIVENWVKEHPDTDHDPDPKRGEGVKAR